MLKEGKIRLSKSPASALLFIVNKDASIEKKGKRDENDDDHFRPVADWRDLNSKTIPNRYPLPLVAELQDRLAGAKFFTKIDLKSSFNLIRIKEGDK